MWVSLVSRPGHHGSFAWIVAWPSWLLPLCPLALAPTPLGHHGPSAPCSGQKIRIGWIHEGPKCSQQVYRSLRRTVTTGAILSMESERHPLAVHEILRYLDTKRPCVERFNA